MRAPEHDRNRSLGWLALAWMEFFVVHGPGAVQGMPVSHGDEYSGFVADCYSLDADGRMLYDSAFFSRPKGADKSGLGARIGLFEALGPCRFDGWAEGGEVYEDPWGLGFKYVYERGEPMGKPITVPYIRIMATEEGQTGNVYDTIYFNLTDDASPLSFIPGVDAGLTRIVLPNNGEITPSTASSSAKDGGKETWVCFDETHLYNTPELRRMYATVTRNLRKRKREGTWYLETTTMYAPGEESVAEKTYDLAEAIAEGKARRSRLMCDHRWGECEDLTAEDQLKAAILEAFGEAINWNDIESIVNEFYDPRASENDSIRYFLNARTSSADVWLEPLEWSGCTDATVVIPDGEWITLGFDGSRKRGRGVTDATALIGCRLSDGHLFQVQVWEQPDGLAGKDWRVPTDEVDREVRAAFARFNVVGFYADPAKWESYITAWEKDFGAELKVKATRANPVEWWMSGGRAIQIVRATARLHTAIVEREVTHDGSTVLSRHVRNCHVRESRTGIQVSKESPHSARKIDAAVAAILAYECRADAVSQGVQPVETWVPRRIR